MFGGLHNQNTSNCAGKINSNDILGRYVLGNRKVEYMKQKRRFFKQAKLLLVVSFAMGVPSLSNAEESAQEGLQRCGLIGDTSERVACYDKLGERENSIAEKTIAEKAIEQPALPPDDLGAGSLTHRKDKQVEKPVSFIVKVTECRRRGGNEKYIFYLEGGQVWKQISDKRLYFRECNFSATILKDFFGYKMQLEDSKKFRISRIR